MPDPQGGDRNVRARIVLTSWLLLHSAAVLVAQQQPAGDTSAPADTTARPSRLLAFPFLFYQPETRLGGGGAGLRTYRVSGSTRQSADNLMLVATTRRQFSATLMRERYGRGDRWRHAGELTWSRFPDLFYGIGNATRAADEERFTLESRRVLVDLRRAVARGLYLGGMAAAQRSIMREVAPGILDTGGVAGSRGATLVAVGAVAVLDRRDHLFTPTRGLFATLLTRLATPAFGSDVRYLRSELDVRQYAQLAGGVVASQALVTVIDGDAPFFDLAVLGGPSVLRGYYEGRYRDNSRAVAQVEYRRHVWRRLGVAAFGGAGQVAHATQDFGLDRFHVSGGAGLRLLVSRADRVNARIDLGVGRGSGGVYFGFGEAF